jgi:hypothetical protein
MRKIKSISIEGHYPSTLHVCLNPETLMCWSEDVMGNIDENDGWFFCYNPKNELIFKINQNIVNRVEYFR